MVVPNCFACAVSGLEHVLLNPALCNPEPGGDDVEHSYTHVQAVAASVWVVNHGLTWNPAGIQIRDDADQQAFADAQYTIDGQQVTLTFGAPTAGTAWLS